VRCEYEERKLYLLTKRFYQQSGGEEKDPSPGGGKQWQLKDGQAKIFEKMKKSASI